MSYKPFSVRLAARLRRNQIWSTITALTGVELKPQKWIFIVGCYNSGTTLLEKILSLHPMIGSLRDEGVMLTDSLPRPEDYGWRRMWWKCEDLMKVNTENEAKIAKRIKRHWSHFYPSKPYLIEKSISNTARTKFFQQNFQPAYFIHLIRNGYAVAKGIQCKATIMKTCPLWPQQTYPLNYCIMQWKRSLEVIDRDKMDLINFLEIRYEDLVKNPFEVVANICNFLSLPQFPMERLQQNFKVHEKNSKIQNMNIDSLSRLSKNEIALINSVAEDLLFRYGYLIPEI